MACVDGLGLNAGLVNGPLPHMQPSNATPEQHQARHSAAVEREVVEQARAQLIAECGRPGPVRDCYVEWCAEFGITTPRQFVRMVEHIDAKLWRERCNALMLAALGGGAG